MDNDNRRFEKGGEEKRKEREEEGPKGVTGIIGMEGSRKL
jgi:hypothetical protein